MNKPRIQLLLPLISNTPFLSWVLIGFLISYLFLFVRPIFFSSQVMQFPNYVPAINPIGVDLKQMLSYSESWFIAKQTPYIGNNLYPPLASVLFTPLLSVKFSVAYKIVTLVTFLLYSLTTLVLPLQIGKERQVSSLLIFVFITGLFSYGFQFELERGQFNVISAFICFLGIWIYHYHNKYRYLAYILFTISVQLKVFPIIFIVMFVTDWQDWKNNFKRLLILLAVNFALFLVLGPNVFFDFIKAIKAQTVNPYIWIGNHSIRSFVSLVSRKAAEHGWTQANEYSGLAQLTLLAVVAICIFLIILQAYRQKQNGIDSHLLLACTIGALLIPAVSHDYKLSILAAPVAILLSDMSSFSERAIRPCQRLIFIVMILFLSASYSLTLFSFTNKPLLIKNNCPALFAMLLAITCLSVMSKPSLDVKVSATQKTT